MTAGNIRASTCDACPVARGLQDGTYRPGHEACHGDVMEGHPSPAICRGLAEKNGWIKPHQSMSSKTRFIYGAIIAAELPDYSRNGGKVVTDLHIQEYLAHHGLNALEKFVDDLVAEDSYATVISANPVVHNFLHDDYAKENVYYLDRNRTLHLVFTGTFPVFKLDVLGPGEALCDTDLEAHFNPEGRIRPPGLSAREYEESGCKAEDEAFIRRCGEATPGSPPDVNYDGGKAAKEAADKRIAENLADTFVVVVVERGAVAAVHTDRPARFTVLDTDTEGSDNRVHLPKVTADLLDRATSLPFGVCNAIVSPAAIDALLDSRTETGKATPPAVQFFDKNGQKPWTIAIDTIEYVDVDPRNPSQVFIKLLPSVLQVDLPQTEEDAAEIEEMRRGKVLYGDRPTDGSLDQFITK